jgi:hypothetical protein
VLFLRKEINLLRKFSLLQTKQKYNLSIVSIYFLKNFEKNVPHGTIWTTDGAEYPPHLPKLSMFFRFGLYLLMLLAYTTVGKLKVRIFNVAAPSTRTACASHPTPETSS